MFVDTPIALVEEARFLTQRILNKKGENVFFKRKSQSSNDILPTNIQSNIVSNLAISTYKCIKNIVYLLQWREQSHWHLASAGHEITVLQTGGESKPRNFGLNNVLSKFGTLK
uniref:Uncharacterized protein n=1 Tax=Ditylenchus dipsaci TaxID=166011 RepID=A0A915ECI3_9BILA